MTFIGIYFSPVPAPYSSLLLLPVALLRLWLVWPCLFLPCGSPPYLRLLCLCLSCACSSPLSGCFISLSLATVAFSSTAVVLLPRRFSCISAPSLSLRMSCATIISCTCQTVISVSVLNRSPPTTYANICWLSNRARLFAQTSSVLIQHIEPRSPLRVHPLYPTPKAPSFHTLIRWSGQLQGNNQNTLKELVLG
ncbi:hypothetical protein BD289DRAFT_77436 [Coniella lustricola]|uniref:Uncharacterized protein n=1 Tax=Coniella lustricola TaxID=2025994 RepID=A0A2T2ZZD0_9PEZI|nr:hypothetical protein BD289DRAFT_77436 [Coniella lustricola]